MREISTYTPSDLEAGDRKNLTLLICDEEFISCRNLRLLQKKIESSDHKVVLVMPDYQYRKGQRGWAKIQILSSMAEHLRGVMPLDHESAIEEMKDEWAEVLITGEVKWDKLEAILSESSEKTELAIQETTDELDKKMIARAKEIRQSSNCWLDPAGSVFVIDGNILVESASTSFNHSECREIPIDFKDLELISNERMLFCDSLHSERMGISQAAKNGISLEGSTMYVTKFPCRPCAQSAIAAGITTIVFEKGSYGLIETVDLFDGNKITLKKVI